MVCCRVGAFVSKGGIMRGQGANVTFFCGWVSVLVLALKSDRKVIERHAF